MRCSFSRSRTPACSPRSLARAQDFVDVEAEGEEAEEEDDDDDGLDLPQLSPPPALQSPHPALLSPQPVATPVTPAVAAIQVRPAQFPALRDTARLPCTRRHAARITASAYRPCYGPCDGSRTCSTSRCPRRHRRQLPSERPARTGWPRWSRRYRSSTSSPRSTACPTVRPAAQAGSRAWKRSWSCTSPTSEFGA